MRHTHVPEEVAVERVEALLRRVRAFEPDDPMPEWLILDALDGPKGRATRSGRGYHLLLAVSTAVAGLSFFLRPPVMLLEAAGAGVGGGTSAAMAPLGRPYAAAGVGLIPRGDSLAAPFRAGVTPAPVRSSDSGSHVTRRAPASRMASTSMRPPAPNTRLARRDTERTPIRVRLPRARWKVEVATHEIPGWRVPAWMVEEDQATGGWRLIEGAVELTGNACEPRGEDAAASGTPWITGLPGVSPMPIRVPGPMVP